MVVKELHRTRINTGEDGDPAPAVIKLNKLSSYKRTPNIKELHK